MFQDYRPRITRFLLVALLFSVIPATSSTAAQTMTACVTKKTGAMRLLTKGTCKKTEKKMTWNVQGEQGIPGVAGTAGPVGPAGATGPAGAAGTNGAAGVSGKDGIDGKSGNTILYGTTNPTASIGVAGDFYINTATSTLFGPKTTNWPNGTSLVGPTGAGAAGPAGPAGAQGPAGPEGASGASTSVIWLTPRQLLDGRSGENNAQNVNSYGADTSTVAPLKFGGSFQGNFHPQVLELKAGYASVVLAAIPKGWEEATKLRINVHWLLGESTSNPVAFEVVVGSRGIDGSNFGPDTQGQDAWGSFAAPVPPIPFATGKKLSAGPDKMNVHQFDWFSFGKIQDGELLTVSLFRNHHAISGFNDVYQGPVYIMGVSIQAIFP